MSLIDIIKFHCELRDLKISKMNVSVSGHPSLIGVVCTILTETRVLLQFQKSIQAFWQQWRSIRASISVNPDHHSNQSILLFTKWAKSDYFVVSQLLGFWWFNLLGRVVKPEFMLF